MGGERNSCLVSIAILNLPGESSGLRVKGFTRSSSPTALTSSYDSFCIMKLKCLVYYCNIKKKKVSVVKAYSIFFRLFLVLFTVPSY